MRGKITKRLVDSVGAGASDIFIWDTEIKGFGLKVTPRGRKVYILQYRIPGRPTPKRFTFGLHGALTPTQARQRAQEILAQVTTGIDPAEARAAERKALTLVGAAEQFVAEHCRAKLKPRSAQEYQRLFELYIVPALGCLRLRDVRRQHVARLHHAMRDKPYAANRMLAVLSKFMNWAEERGLRPEAPNPCRHIKKYREQGRERFLSEAELARLGTAVVAYEASGGDPYIAALIRLLATTGARLSEWLTMRWDFIDFERGVARLPESKTGAKTVFLGPPALAILVGLPRIEDSPYVLPGRKDGTHLSPPQHAWRRIRAAAGLDDVRLHDLRHGFASTGAVGGLSLPVLGALLGHTQPATTQRYAHLSADPLRAAADSISGRIAAAMAGDRADNIARLDRKHE